LVCFDREKSGNPGFKEPFVDDRIDGFGQLLIWASRGMPFIHFFKNDDRGSWNGIFPHPPNPKISRLQFSKLLKRYVIGIEKFLNLYNLYLFFVFWNL
jgi:hypothetical protein